MVSRQARVGILERICAGDPEKAQLYGFLTDDGADGHSPMPAIVRRQSCLIPERIDVGWASWETKDGSRIRIADAVSIRDVEQVITPYEVFEREDRWPEAVRGQLLQAAVLGQKENVRIGLIGSCGMQALTGRPYIREGSDLDLILEAPREVLFGGLTAFWRGLQAIPGRRIDMELQLFGIGGVKLAEWMSGQRSVLVKSLTDVTVRDRNEILEEIDKNVKIGGA